MKQITSRTNEEIKSVKALHDSKTREQEKKYIAEGLRTCTTLIKSGAKIVQLYVTDAHLASGTKLVNEFFLTHVPEHVMEKMSAASTPSGILGVFEIPATPNMSELNSGLVLANISDPGNMGSLIRTCAALNIKTVVVVDGADVWSPKVVQASAGTLAQVSIFSLSWPTLIKWKKDTRLCALVVKGGKKAREIDFTKTLLIVGNEANGIDPLWLRDCTDYMTIEMPGNVESLNVAVAGSLGLYLAFGPQSL